MQNEIDTDLPASVNQKPVAEREIKQKSFSVHIHSPEIPTMRKCQKVTIEDILDDDDIQYLGQRQAWENAHYPIVELSTKVKACSRAMATPLSNLMEQQIEDVIAGRLKCGPGNSRLPGFQKIPGQYI